MLERVLSNLIRVNSRRLAYLKDRIAPYGYTGTMHLIILYTNRHPGTSQEEIIAYYRLDKSSVARDARKLEDLGHLTRTIDPNNRRKYQLEVTEAGREFRNFIIQTDNEFAAELAKNFTPEEWEQLSELLSRMDNIK